MTVPVVEVFSDLHCPHAYLTRYRLREVADRLEEDVRFVSRCLSIELATDSPTPRGILGVETHSLVLQEDEIPYEPWPDEKITQWPVTFLPAFEAVKAAEAIDQKTAWELDWRIREAFFAEHRCVSLRHVLADLAAEVGFARDAFLEEWDTGRHRETVIEESREGWQDEGFTHSPSIRYPDGSTEINPGDHWTEMDPDRNFRLTGFDPGRADEVGYLVDRIEEALEEA